MMKYRYIKSFLLVALVVSTQLLWAQTAEAPFHYETVNVDFGIHDGISIDELDANGVQLTTMQPTQAWTIAFPASTYNVLEENISTIDHAPWMQLVFGSVNLGENSYLVITSEYDQDQQFFNNQTIEEWTYHSAFFKGEEVTVALYVAPGDENITCEVAEVIAGEYTDGQVIPLSQCGSTDDRSSSGIPYTDGRLMPLGCTGWIGGAGYYLTAGHCLNVANTSLQIMEFDIPASLANGTTQPAAVNNQYPVIYSSRVFQDVQIGDDWGLYNCGANSNTGLTPVEARRTFYHLSRALTPTTIQIRGFGVDDEPPGTTGFRNADNQTLQWHSGPSLGENIVSADRVIWEYQVDTEGGNSGSAIRDNGSADLLLHSIGIHTNAGCNLTAGTGNTGTSFEANDTETAMNTFWQTQVEYVDVDHHLTATTGSSVYPHHSLQTALNQANAGHGPSVSALELIMIAGSNLNGTYGAGVYAESVSYSGATNGVLLRQAIGAIKIGPGAVASSNISFDSDVEATPQQ